MDPALQRRVQRYGWDKAAAYYENFWQQQLKPAQEKLMELADLQPGNLVNDIACGTGLVSFPAAERVGPNGQVLATDISDAMVTIGNETAAAKQYRNVRFDRMDAEALEVPDHSFDVSLCALGLMYVPDPLKALTEMFRVTRVGGRSVAAVWGRRNHCGWADIFEIVDRRVSSEVCPLFFQLGNEGMLMRHFEMAGFSEVKESRINTSLVYATPEDAYGAAFAGGPVALAYNRFSEQVKLEVHQEYLDSISQFKSGNGYVVSGEFVIATGLRR